MFLTKRLVALGARLAFVGYWPVGLVVLDCPFLSDERTGKRCHLPPPSHLWEGGLCLLKRPSLDALVFLPAAQRDKSQGSNLARRAKNSGRFLTCPCVSLQ